MIANATHTINYLAHGRNRKRIIMLHPGRCGSTVLGGMLNKHSQITWASEVFAFNSLIPRHRQILGSRKGNLRVIRDIITWSSKAYCGFELKYLPHQHLGPHRLNQNLSDFIDSLDSLRMSAIIVLSRQNLLRQLISALVAEKSGIWHTSNKSTRPITLELSIDDVFKDDPWLNKFFQRKITLIEYFEYIKSHEVKLQNIVAEQKKLLQLVYEEDIEKDPNIAYGKVCDLLGLDKEPVPTAINRTNPFNLKDIILNFRELENHLHSTEFEWMLWR